MLETGSFSYICANFSSQFDPFTKKTQQHNNINLEMCMKLYVEIYMGVGQGIFMSSPFVNIKRRKKISATINKIHSKNFLYVILRVIPLYYVWPSCVNVIQLYWHTCTVHFSLSLGRVKQNYSFVLLFHSALRDLLHVLTFPWNNFSSYKGGLLWVFDRWWIS